MLRAQLPVYSPLPLAALGAGLRATFGGRRGVTDEVEARLRALYSPPQLLLTDSGTSALAIALTLGLTRRSGPVALPAFCCYDVATAADAAAIPFTLYDLDPTTLGPDFDSLRAALEFGAGTVVVAHLYGIPVDMSRVRALAAEFDAAVIDDAAQGVGVGWCGNAAGTMGQYGVLSFGRGKGVTGGAGGALLANTPSAAADLSALRPLPAASSTPVLALTTAAQWMLARPSVYGLPLALPFLGLGDTAYRRPHLPTRPTTFSLGVLSRTLRDRESETTQRRRNAGRLLAAADATRAVRGYRAPAGAEAGYLRFPVLPEGERARLVSPGARRMGVWPSYPKSLADLPGFGDRRVGTRPCPGARRLAAGLVTLPTHSRLTEDDLRALERMLAAAGDGLL
jgi:dTDP-4-amino-4,6-dideoxygalactose transaminase